MEKLLEAIRGVSFDINELDYDIEKGMYDEFPAKREQAVQLLHDLEIQREMLLDDELLKSFTPQEKEVLVLGDDISILTQIYFLLNDEFFQEAKAMADAWHSIREKGG